MLSSNKIRILVGFDGLLIRECPSKKVLKLVLMDCYPGKSIKYSESFVFDGQQALIIPSYRVIVPFLLDNKL